MRWLLLLLVAVLLGCRCGGEHESTKPERIGKIVVVGEAGWGTWVKDLKTQRVGFYDQDFGQRGDTLAIDLNNVEWK